MTAHDRARIAVAIPSRRRPDIRRNLVYLVARLHHPPRRLLVRFPRTGRTGVHARARLLPHRQAAPQAHHPLRYHAPCPSAAPAAAAWPAHHPHGAHRPRRPPRYPPQVPPPPGTPGTRPRRALGPGLGQKRTTTREDLIPQESRVPLDTLSDDGKDHVDCSTRRDHLCRSPVSATLTPAHAACPLPSLPNPDTAPDSAGVHFLRRRIFRRTFTSSPSSPPPAFCSHPERVLNPVGYADGCMLTHHPRPPKAEGCACVHGHISIGAVKMHTHNHPPGNELFVQGSQPLTTSCRYPRKHTPIFEPNVCMNKGG